MEKRIVLLDTVHKKATDQKYDVTIKLKTQQDVMDFYAHFGFSMEQFDRTKDNHLDNIVVNTKENPIFFQKRVNIDETVLVFVRDESQADLVFEDEIFAILKSVDKEKSEIQNIYSSKLFNAVLLSIGTCGLLIPLYIYYKKKRNTELGILELKYDDTIAKVYSHITPTFVPKEENKNKEDTVDLSEDLQKLKKIYQDGLITEEEYNAKRKKLLDL